jgi:hypothetical protein
MKYASAMAKLPIVVVIGFVSFLIVLFIAEPDVTKQFLGNNDELFKQTYQFLLTSVIGGGVALVYKQLDHFREMRKSLREMHTEILQAFNQAKTVRRRLRTQLGTVRAVDPEERLSAELYDNQIDLLSDAQLVFEIYAKRAKSRTSWFGENNKLSVPLSKVEAYLNQIVKEYQEKRATSSGTPPTCRVGDLPRLMEFIGPYEKSCAFRESFKYPISDVLEELGNAVLR